MYLEPGKYYHIYNHANGFESTFRNKDNFTFFLNKFRFHLTPFVDTYVYCLMPNHFHFLIRVKSREEMLESLEKVLEANNFHQLQPFQTFPKLETLGKLVEVDGKIAIEALPDFFRLERLSPSSRIKAFQKCFSKYCQLKSIPDSASNEANEFIGKWLSRQFGDLFSSYAQAFNKQFGRMGGLFIKTFQRKEVNSFNYIKTLVVYIHKNPVDHGFVKKPGEWSYSSFNDIINNRNSLVDVTAVINWFDSTDNFIYCHNQTPVIDSGYTFEE
ncbi:hypothetical protein SDC9_67007 [bioreactor metagenome]|uniref:Transposase IS200-like domain-containing protein n=1 Tax=bioreactor metagenome TaxID=1076179 RepID=A0A644XWF6_9ZZZZ